jgi:hypothetical protein
MSGGSIGRRTFALDDDPTAGLRRRRPSYQYLGSAIWFTRIGHAMGDAMLTLLKPAK